MLSNQFSGTDRRVLTVLTVFLLAGMLLNLYRKSTRTVSPALLLSALEIPPSNLSNSRSLGVSNRPDGPLDLNRAGVERLQELPGVGPALAQRIVEYREQKGGFKAVQELLRISGIGPKKLAQLQAKVYVSRPNANSRVAAAGAAEAPDAGRSLPESSLISSNTTPK